MIISGIDKNNNLEIINNNTNIKDLEIKNFSLDDDWSLITKAKNLENLTIRDSYVDYKKFYNAICSLKKLNKLTLNHYCYFNKKKKDKLQNLNLPSLKIFRLEFPDPEEPDFEINTYWQKSYKNKYNSITEVKDSHKVFNNLEQIEFVNYQTYKKKIINEDEKKDIKKLNSEIYWNMSLKDLNKFKLLKNIKINQGDHLDIIKLGLNNLFPKKEKLKFFINGLNQIDEKFYSEIKNLIIFSHDKVKTNISEISPKITFQFKNILDDNACINLDTQHLYKSNGYGKPFKLIKNKKITNFLNNEFYNIIFESCYGFLRNNTYSNNDRIKKTDVFLKILYNNKKIQNIIFDFSRNEYYKDDEWDQDQFKFIVKFIYEILRNFPKIKIYLYHEEIQKLLKNKETLDKFKIHFIYLINYIFQNKEFINDRVVFVGVKNEEILKIYENYLKNEIDQIVVIDDLFYDLSKSFFNKDIIYSEELSDLQHHFPRLQYNSESGWEKSAKTPLMSIYSEILRIVSFDSIDFQPSSDKLLLLVKKNYLKFLPNIKLKKIYYYLGSPLHLVTQHMQHNEKNWNAKKVVGALVNNNPEGIEKIKDKLFKAAELSVDTTINSGEINVDEKTKENFLISTDHYGIIQDSGIEKNNLNELTHCWFEGVNPWQGKYIKLSEIDKVIPSKKLEALKLSDCIYLDDLEFPYMEKLKILELHPYQNHHAYEINPSEMCIKKFENCPNLEKLIIKNLWNFFNGALFNKTLGFSGYSTNLHYTDTYGYINVDLSNLHKLTKLTNLDISDVSVTDVKKIQFLPNLEKLSLKVFNLTEYDHLYNSKPFHKIEPPIKDNDLEFFKKSKKLNELYLNLGDAPHVDFLEGWIYSGYNGNGGFLNFINYKIKKLNLSINIEENNLDIIQDIINNITNRFLFLEELRLTFGVTLSNKNFNFEEHKFNKELKTQILDFKKFSKLKKLTILELNKYGNENFIKFKTINLDFITKLEKITDFYWCFESVSFSELRKARIALKNEKYSDPSYYDYDYEYYAEDDENYKKNWSRSSWINTSSFDDYYSFEDRYIAFEKEESKKKYNKPIKIIKKTKIN